MTAVLESSALEAAAAPVAPRGEDALARTALVVVALGVADDAFVHREPGTAIGDLVACGLLPAAWPSLSRSCIPGCGPACAPSWR